MKRQPAAATISRAATTRKERATRKMQSNGEYMYWSHALCGTYTLLEILFLVCHYVFSSAFRFLGKRKTRIHQSGGTQMIFSSRRFEAFRSVSSNRRRQREAAECVSRRADISLTRCRRSRRGGSIRRSRHSYSYHSQFSIQKHQVCFLFPSSNGVKELGSVSGPSPRTQKNNFMLEYYLF